MATKIYYLDENKTEHIQCTWGPGWKDFKVEYNDQSIGELAGRKELKGGITYNLTTDKTLQAKLKQGLSQELELLVNGKPVQGSATDPATQIKLAFSLTLIMAALNILLGLLAMVMNSPFLNNMGLGMGSLIFGVIMLALAFGIRRKMAWAAFAVAVLLTADIIISIILTMNSGGNPPTAGILLRIIFIIYIFRGGIAANKIN